MNINTLNDVISFIYTADSIEFDVTSGSDFSIPRFEISPEEFLEFAENAMNLQTKEGLVNAVSNLKRAAECAIDLFLETINVKNIYDSKNLKFGKKLEFLTNIGLLPVKTITKLNTKRNRLEHHYDIPNIDDLEAYYELVWSIVKIINLTTELLNVNSELNFVVYKENQEYYVTVFYERENRAFKYEINDYSETSSKEKINFSVILQDKNNQTNYQKALALHMACMHFFYNGNYEIFKKEIKKLLY